MDRQAIRRQVFEYFVPIDDLKWKTVDDYVLNTPLGTHTCRADVLDSGQYAILKPGEDERLERLQVGLFCGWVIEMGGVILAAQLKYILEVLEMSQAALPAQGQTCPDEQSSRKLASLFKRMVGTEP